MKYPDNFLTPTGMINPEKFGNIRALLAIFNLMKKHILLLVAFIPLLSIAQENAAIEQWRGPDRNGVYPDTNLLTHWPEKGPELLWVLKDIPAGHSSATIANNTIFLTGLADSMDVLIASDMNGKLKWQIPYGRAWHADFPESRCTPTIEENRGYATSGMGDVVCFNTENGQILWKVAASEKFGGTFGEWGIAESPLLFKNTLIFTPGGDRTTMVALDKMTGETVWMSEPLNDNPGYVSPLLINRGGKDVIISVIEKHAFGVNAETGHILWDFDYGSYSNSEGWNININTPLYDNGEIFVTNGYDHKSVMLKLAEDAKSVALKWVDSTLDVHTGGVVKMGNYIYGANWMGNGMGHWVCLEWSTGRVMYDQKWFNKGSIVAADGMLYCLEEKSGNLALVEPTPDYFKVVSSFKVPYGSGPYWSHPLIKDGVLYVRHGDALMAYQVSAKQ